METPQDFLNRAFVLLLRTDPIPKLLPQVRLGRMPKDSPALQAIISSWLEGFAALLKEGETTLDVNAVLRLDPHPRLEVLVEAGVLAPDDPKIAAVRSAYVVSLEAAKLRDDVPA